MKRLTPIARIGLYAIFAVLAANALRLVIPQAPAHAISVVPYTVVLAETMTDPTGVPGGDEGEV